MGDCVSIVLLLSALSLVGYTLCIF